MIEYKNLTYEEKKELLRLLEIDGIKINQKNYSDKRMIFDSLWGDSICLDQLRKAIIETVDIITVNYEEKLRNKERSFVRRSDVPESLKDEYTEITELLIKAVLPYSEKAIRNWNECNEIRRNAKCDNCEYRKPLGKDSYICANRLSCYYRKAVNDKYGCMNFEQKNEPQ